MNDMWYVTYGYTWWNLSWFKIFKIVCVGGGIHVPLHTCRVSRQSPCVGCLLPLCGSQISQVYRLVVFTRRNSSPALWLDFNWLRSLCQYSFIKRCTDIKLDPLIDIMETIHISSENFIINWSQQIKDDKTDASKVWTCCLWMRKRNWETERWLSRDEGSGDLHLKSLCHGSANWDLFSTVITHL